jgi:NTE family protein
VAILREERGVARFERLAVVLSGGAALGAYQAGALAAMEAAGFQPHWLAGSGVGAINAAIFAGNSPRERAPRLRAFWRGAGRLALPPKPLPRLAAMLGRRPKAGPSSIDPAKLRALLAESIDFARINSGVVRLSLAALHLPSGTEAVFDNDRHRLGVDHVLAGAGLAPGLPPVRVGGEPYGGGLLTPAPIATLLDGAPPADMLCFVVDCYDPAPPGWSGQSRAGRLIAAYRRGHDLRRAIGLLGERMPAELRRDPEIRRCLAQGTTATATLVHLVHEGSAEGITGKLADFSAGSLLQRWQAGERDMQESLGRPAWLASSTNLGLVVHELRGGDARPPRSA